MDKEIGKRILEFIDLLQESPVKIVYFKQKEKELNVKQILKKFEIEHQPFYINSGPSGAWMYIYRLDDIKYLFTRVDTTVQAFIGKISTASVGGASFDTAHIGSHLTVGIEEQDKEIHLTSHFTDYKENTSNFQDFKIIHSMKCEVPLNVPITNDTQCGMKSSQKIKSVYKPFPLWIKVLQMIQKVANGEGGDIHRGPRGGKYKLDGTRKFYFKKLSGGASILTEALLDMLYIHIIEPVQNTYSKENMFSIQSILFYDEAHPNFVLLYINEEHYTCKIFYLEVEKVITAYKAYSSKKPSIESSRCLDELRSIAHNHIREVQTM